MGCEKIRELILEYPNGDLDQSEKLQVEVHLRECKDCNLFFDESREIWNLLDKWGTVETKENFVAKFWDRVSEEGIKKGGIVGFFKNWKLNWTAAVAVVVILIVIAVLGNFLGPNRANVVFTEKDMQDEKLLIEFDKAISREEVKSLEIYGPWGVREPQSNDEKLEENKGG